MTVHWKWLLAPLGLGLLFGASSHANAPAVKTPAPEQPATTLPYTPSLDVPSMDKSVDPCVDFYTYSCGGWMKNNPIPADEAAWNVYRKLHRDNERFLWGVLDKAKEPRPDRSAVERQIGDYFAACMNEPAVEAAGLQPIAPQLAAIAKLHALGELPPLLGRLHLSLDEHPPLFGFGSDKDYADSTQVIAFAVAGGIGLPDRDYYTKTDPKSVEIRQRYVAHIAEMLRLGGDAPRAAEAEAKRIMALETALARASLTRTEARDPHKLFHKLSRAQLQALTPSFPWDPYFQTLGVAGATIVNVTEPAFFKALEGQLKALDLPTLQAYLRWHLLRAQAPFLSRPFADASFAFYKKYLRGVAAQPPRWRRCEELIDRDLGEALGQIFVQKTFGPEVRQRTLTMTLQVEAAMQREIEALPWMGPASKKQALEKLHLMVNKIGYPDRWRDYSSIEIKRDDFVGDVARAGEFEARRQLAKIGRPVDRGEWQMTPPTVNAYYDPHMNDINFPAGVLQPPLFDFKLDDAPNYGNTGATIGHELTHGFDDEGRKFDAHGNLRDWWTAKDAAQFDQRAACVVDQYAHYTVVDDIKINSKLTLGEDVADLGGTLLAYLAWQSATKGQPLQPRDGFTPDQRFFVGMAQWACANERDENKRANAITNEHSPDQYRINGVVANLPEFAAAFACKPGQPMARVKPCRIW